jgi:fructose-1,6-bisphosphatase/inositol monophosphatase family enzyme
LFAISDSFLSVQSASLVKELINACRSAQEAVRQQCVNNRIVFDQKVAVSGELEVFSSADLAAENAIFEYLKNSPITSNYQLIGEESLYDGQLPDTFIAIDPIDGTLNFKNRGISAGAEWAHLIGVVERTRLRCGVIYLPCIEENNLIFGQVDDQVISASSVTGHSEIVTPFSLRSGSSAKEKVVFANGPWLGTEEFKVIDRLRQRDWSLVECSCSATGFRQVINGEADCYLALTDRLWDAVAGASIVTALGGAIRVIRTGSEYNWSCLKEPLICGRSDSLVLRILADISN